eukprot:CAMPEP_0172901590 /NCGR_PEP_ID=MMETSP1075-20121228/166575_1 /TAXON_ID=2916 /ORGANISM="Ceratium fusus, Strain PA161109" /LENGTH=95 /DNA_ID=CAMNT_0013758017 /DNA_START=21 /DNA_END=305 /DNA_ORIENTATION=-
MEFGPVITAGTTNLITPRTPNVDTSRSTHSGLLTPDDMIDGEQIQLHPIFTQNPTSSQLLARATGAPSQTRIFEKLGDEAEEPNRWLRCLVSRPM